MKVLNLLSLAASAMAYNTWIASPGSGDQVIAGSDLTIDLQMTEPSGPLVPVAVSFGIFPCGTSACSTRALGEPISNQLWEFDGFAPQGGTMFTNFTVTIPASFPTGTANLTATWLYVSGSSYDYEPETGTAWTKVNVAASS